MWNGKEQQPQLDAIFCSFLEPKNTKNSKRRADEMEGTITGKFFKDSDVLPLYDEQTLPVLEWRSSLGCPARSQHQGTSTSASAHEFSVVLVASTWCHTDLIPFARVLCNALPPDHHRHPDWMMTAEPIAGIGRLSSWPHTALPRAELRKAPTPHHRTPVQQVGMEATHSQIGPFVAELLNRSPGHLAGCSSQTTTPTHASKPPRPWPDFFHYIHFGH